MTTCTQSSTCPTVTRGKVYGISINYSTPTIKTPRCGGSEGITYAHFVHKFSIPPRYPLRKPSYSRQAPAQTGRHLYSGHIPDTRPTVPWARHLAAWPGNRPRQGRYIRSV